MNRLLGKTLEELQTIALEVGLPRFAGKQLAEWIYIRRATSFDDMTNISLKGREALKARYTIGRHAPIAEAISKDGTKKYLFRISNSERSERSNSNKRRGLYRVCLPTRRGPSYSLREHTSWLQDGMQVLHDWNARISWTFDCCRYSKPNILNS